MIGGKNYLSVVQHGINSVQDHLRDMVLREPESVNFITLINAHPLGIFCHDNGIRETVIPRTGNDPGLSLRRETKSLLMLENMDLKNVTEITKLSWKQAWNILVQAV